MTRARIIGVPIRLALLRLRARKLAFALITGGLAAAAALVAWSGVAAALAQQENARFRLAELPPDERALQVVEHLQPGVPRFRANEVQSFFGKFSPITDRPRRVQVWHSVTRANTRLVVADDPRRDVVVVQGRLAGGCSRHVCEAVAVAGGYRVGDRVEANGVRLLVVGVGSIRRDALPVDSRTLPRTPDLGNDALLVRTVDPPLVPLTTSAGSSVVTTASLAPGRVDAAELRELLDEFRVQSVELERAGGLLEVSTPFALIDEIADRGDIARERLLLIAGQGAALIVAFAAFAATARRRDIELADDQLMTLGASRAQVDIARATEAVLPALIGGIAGVVGVVVAAAVLARNRALPLEFVGASVGVATVLAVAAVAVFAAVLLFLAGRPRRTRRGIGPLEVAAIAALGTVLWQAATTGALDTEAIETGARSSPVLLLLPALTFLVSGVVVLRVLPFLLVVAERAARRGPFAARLALLSAARRPAEAAAATTFLAVALGAALFATNYEATLDRQARDEAAFAVGASWRVVEAADTHADGDDVAHVDVARIGADVRPPGTAEESALTSGLDVTPLSRFGLLTHEAPTSAIRVPARVQEASATAGDLDVEVLAIPAGRLHRVTGWRAAFSDVPREELALRLRPRAVRLEGPRAVADADAIRFWARSDASLPRFVVFHLLNPREQTFTHVRVGVLTRTWQPLAIELPARLGGAQLVAIEFPALRVPLSAPPDRGSIEFGRFEQRRAGRWAPLRLRHGWRASGGSGDVEVWDRRGPVRRVTQFSLQGAAVAVVRQAVAFPDPIPTVASPSVVRAAVGGLVTISVAGRPIRLRVAARARFFPTITTRPRDFVVVDYDTFFGVLNGTQPGGAPPTEAWFFRPPATPLDRLADSPFRVQRAVSLDAMTERRLSDPLAAGARQVLVLSAAAAAALALLGLIIAARATLAAERVLLAEYEALGVRPRTLVHSAQLRLVILSLLGIAAGFVGATAAVRLIGALVAVTGGAGRPLPPIDAIVAWRTDIAILLATAIVAAVTATRLAHQALRETAARRLRG